MEEVPEEILEEIFSYLDVKSLLAAVQVSELWSSIIKSSVRIGRNISVTVRHFPPEFLLKYSGYIYTDLVPIDLKYGHVNIQKSGHSVAVADVNQYWTNLSTTLSTIKKNYIYKLTLSSHHANNFMKSWLSGITHLNISHAAYNLRELAQFKDLKRLELTVQAIIVDPSEVNIQAKLTHLKIVRYLGWNSPNIPINENIFNSTLQSQTSTLQELRLLNIQFNFQSVQQFIADCHQLKVLELGLDGLTGCLDLLESIKRLCTWKELSFERYDHQHLDLVHKITANHPEVSSITIRRDYFYDTVEEVNLRFSSDDESNRSIDEYTNCHSLGFNLCYKRRKVIASEIMPSVRGCRDLRVLKFIVKRISIAPSIMSSILEDAKNLEELHFQKGYSDNIGTEILKVIKDQGKNLKRLFLTVVPERIDSMRENIKIFNDTNVSVVLMASHRQYVPSQHKSCTWKK